MGLQSALSTALTGLQASETTIDVIGNNVANSNTVGFKQSDVIFATQFLQTLSSGSAPSESTGGTNPRQIGLGVKVAKISPDFSQGTIEISSNPLDLAIQGDGFLIVQGSQGQPLYTRNGQLSLNSQNQVVNASGNKLLGYTVDDEFDVDNTSLVPLEIALGSERVAQSTSEASFAGVLNPTVEPGVLPGTLESEVLGNGTVEFIDSGFDNTNVLVHPVPTPPSSATAVANPTGLDAGVYQYRIAFRDTDGNTTTASTPVSVTVTAGNQQVDLAGLPTNTSPYDDTVIYRTTLAEPNTFYELATIASATTTYTDTLDDATWSPGPTLELDTDAIDAGNYNYFVTYRNSVTLVESLPTAPIIPIALDNNDSSIRLDLSSIPAPSDPLVNFDKIVIYRNLSNDTSNFYEVEVLDAPGQAGFVSSYIDKASSSNLAANNTLDFDGPRATSATLLTSVQVRNGTGVNSTYENPFVEGTLTFSGEQGGANIEPQNFEITATTTVGDLMGFMTDALGLHETSNVPGAENALPTPGSVTLDDNGVITVVSNLGEQNQIDIAQTAFQILPTGSVVTQTADVLFGEVPPSADGPGTTTEFLVYDSLGAPLRVRITTVLEEFDSNSTTYRWYANSGDSEPTAPDQTIVVGNGLLKFDSVGDLISSPSAQISVLRELTASESPLEIDLDFSSVTALAETNAAGDPVSSLSMTQQNGFPPGVLTDFSITDTGLILGQFSNGTQRTLGQVVMSLFANPSGLEQVGDNLFTPGVNSGAAQLGIPGEDGLGAITAGAVELSNTDIGQDLIQMILAQTQYQAGSRVIAATQELLDELLSLQR